MIRNAVIGRAALAVPLLATLLASCTLLFDTTEDSGDGGEVRFAAISNDHIESSASLSYLVTTPKINDGAMLVSVQMGASCATSSTPIIESVTYAGVGLTQVASVQGVPCGASGTRSEQWLLTEPAPGRHEVIVALSSSAVSIHSSAMVFSDVDPSEPVRSFAATSGEGTASSLILESAAGDLVVNVVGQGSSILDPGPGATARYRANVDSSNTLNNSAGSTAPGAVEVESTWAFGGSDQWQTISVSLQPAP